jgi:hypothetical protein
MHTFRLEQTVVTDDTRTHTQTRYREDRCGICMNLVVFDDHLDRWVHADLTALCHEKAS